MSLWPVPSEGPIAAEDCVKGTKSVVTTIPVGSGPVSAAYDSGNGYVYVSNADQGTISIIAPCAPIPCPSITSFSASPSTGTIPFAVSFNVTVSGGTPPYAYSWDFGDGGSSTQSNPSHTYRVAGTYTVTVTVMDAGGQSVTRTTTVTAGPSAGIPPSRAYVGVASVAAVAVIVGGLLRRRRSARLLPPPPPGAFHGAPR